MNSKKSIFLISALLFAGLNSCGDADADTDAETETTEESAINLAEQRRLELIEKGENDSLTIEEFSELDSLEVEKYKKELEQSILQKVAEEEE